MDWESFFKDHNIEYITRGQNVKKGNLNIACPFCGDDPSYHMGVSLHGRGWGCWRSASHSGIKPHRLIKGLLNCSYAAAVIVVQQYSAADPANLDDALNALEAGDKRPDKPVQRHRLVMPSEFKPIKAHGTTSRFWHYLKGRGFTPVQRLIDIYNLHCAETGKWKDRVIIPIYINNKLHSWTSRALGNPVNAPRYLALSEEEGGLVNIFHALWNWDELRQGGEVLVVAEGPFDALKLDYYGWEFNCCATCTFGTSMSVEQAMLIGEASKNFNRTVLLYDEGATEAIFLAKDKLVNTNVECGFLPAGVEDPGAMTKDQVRDLYKSFM